MLLAMLAWTAVATTYVYDANGRLVVATNDAGASARYVYDAMGNITQVERLAVGDLAIFGFSPARGASGVSVRITGNGFSATPAQNAVKFNGVAASVSAATATQLTAVVPAGATTGRISIVVGAKSATSAVDFIIDENARPPVISSVSPLIAASGTAVTVNGQYLVPVTDQTTVRLNQRPTVPTTLLNTQVVFPVPTTASSGKVTVITPYGVATSAQDMLITPTGVAPADIVQTKRLALDAAAQSFATTTTGQYAAVLFDGATGDYLSAQFSAISVASISYSLYGTANNLLASGTVSPASPTFHLPKLSATGTYLLLMKPESGSATWKLVIEKNKPVATNGASLTVSTAIAGQGKRLTLTATAGQNLGFAVSDLVTPTYDYAGVTVYLYDPSGAYVNSVTCYQAYQGCGLNVSNTIAGTYSVIVYAPAASSGSNGTMSFKTTLSTDVVKTLARNTTSTLALSRRGQNGRMTFAGTAGETVALQVAGQTTVPAGGTTYYYVYRPDGTLLTSTTTTSSTTLNLPNLPATGNYLVFVDTYYGETLNAQVTLATGTTGGEVVNGASGSYTTTVPGQNVYLTFAATAGQNLGFALSDLATPTYDYAGVTVYLYDPSGAYVNSVTCYQAYQGCGLNVSNTIAGTYSVIVYAPSASSGSNGTMSFKTTLSTDVVKTLARNTTSTLALSRRGQNGRLTFAGTAGETVALQVAGQTTVPAGGTTYYYVYRPDGTLLTSTTTTSSTTLNLPNLPATGNYLVFVDTYYGETLNAQVTLATGTTGGEVVNGASGSYTTTVPGQNVYLTFTATAGQNLGFALSDLVTPTYDYAGVTVYLYDPSGAYINSTTCYQAYQGCGLNVSNTIAGTYSVIVYAPSASSGSNGTMSFKTTLSTDVVKTLARNTTSTLALSRRGQNGRLTFAGTAGETVALQVAGQTTVPAGGTTYYYVYRPDGTLLTSTTTTSSTTLNLPNLPATGNYLVFVDTYYGETLNAQVTLATGTTGGEVVNGASGSYTTTVPGQNVYLTFTATAGQNLGFALSDLVTPTYDYAGVTVYLYDPSGAYINSTTCYQAYQGCDLNVSNTIAGTYSVIVYAPSASSGSNGTMSFKTTLSTDVTKTLTRNAMSTLALSRHGQNGRMTFAGTAGETVALQVAGQATAPAGQTVYYTVYRPDGTALTSTSTTSSTTLNLPNLPATGNYLVYVDPGYGATSSAQVMLATGTTGGEIVNGASGSYATTIPGQNVYLTFTATAGQNLGLGISDLVVNTYGYVYVNVYRPDGSYLAGEYCPASSNGCGVNLSNLAAGTYSVIVPASDSSQTMSFKTTLSTDKTATLTRNTTSTLALSHRGQNGRLTFAGTAGETVALQVAGQTTVPADRTTYYTVTRPDGSVLTSTTTTSSTTLNLPNLPATGSYQVFVDPYYGETLSAQVTLATGTTGGEVVNGANGSYATTIPGQNVYLTFTATAGQNLGLGISDLVVNTYGYVYVNVYRPDGSYLSGDYCPSGSNGCGVNLLNLQAGTYSVVIPATGSDQTMSFKTTLSTEVTKTLTRNTASAVALSRRGQNGRLTFSGTAGETVALQVAGQTTVPAGGTTYYTVTRPDGSVLTSSTTASSTTLNLPNLPATGSYQVFVDPYYGETLNAQVTVSAVP